MLPGSQRLRGWPPRAGGAAGLELGPQSSGLEGPAALLRSRRDVGSVGESSAHAIREFSLVDYLCLQTKFKLEMRQLTG